MKMPPKRSSRIKTRASRKKTVTKEPRGNSSSEETDPSKLTDIITSPSKTCRVKPDKSSSREPADCYDGDWENTGSESASQSEATSAPPRHDVEMKSHQHSMNHSSETDSSSSSRRKMKRQQKPRKKTRAAVQKTPAAGILSPGSTPQEEVFTLRCSVQTDPPAKSRPKRAVNKSKGNTPFSKHVLTMKEAYNSTISPPLVGIKPLNASDTSTPSMDARGSASCSFMDDSAFGFGTMEDLPCVTPIELVVSPVKEVSPLVNVRPQRENIAKPMPLSTVSDASGMSPSKLSPSFEHNLTLSVSPKQRQNMRQLAHSHKASSLTIASSSLQTTPSSPCAPVEESTEVFKKPKASANTTDQRLERSPSSTVTSPSSSISSNLVSPQKRKMPPGMNDIPIEPEKEKKRRRKNLKKTKAEMEEWAAHMTAKFNEIESYELEVE
ncbi:PREDICTED: sororin-B-like [Branchiostoma belcheri]|uniref:Sororin-B-like n=1 Tax=Branchiostoma belcheri TaxID=7741 RepID=A0A6P4Y2H7_BRABE|nr:PREDICTED: sororin-B-like [Branchiostoma belcheri]